MAHPTPATGYLKKGLNWQTWMVMGIVLLGLHFLPWIFPQTVHIIIMIYLYATMGQAWNILGEIGRAHV
jgi:hypothetical protein